MPTVATKSYSRDALDLTDRDNQSKNVRRNAGAISAIISQLEEALRLKCEESFHGDVSLTVKIVGHDITEFQIGTTARTLTR
jgi:hypothetical protein